MTVATESEPWHKLPEESTEQYAAFRAYRDQAPPRAVAKSGEHSARTLRAWAALYCWELRAGAYDQSLDDVRVAVDHEAARDSRELLWRMHDLAANELRKYLEASKESETVGMIPPATVVRLAEQTIKLGELLAGRATERVSVHDYSALSDEELDAARAIAEKIR